MTPKSVLVVLHVAQHSGPQRSLAPRLEWLRERGARITTLVPRPGPAQEVAAELGEVVTGAPGALLIPRNPSAAATVARVARRQARAVEDAARAAGADLVIVSSLLMPGALTGARRAGAGALLYSGEMLDRGGARGTLAGLVARLARRRAGAVVVPSRLLADWYARHGVEARVLYPAIPIPEEAEELAERGAGFRRAHGIAPEERLVCSLGAITEGRGQDTLLEALADSERRGAGWRLVIGGEPYERAVDLAFARRLRALAAGLGLGERVVFAGRVDDPQALYAAADAFVNPARVPESFGRAACEALACRCPVVSARVGGVVEALRDGETALLVEPESASELGVAIERLIGDSGLALSLARTGAADVRCRFAPEASAAVFDTAVRATLAAATRA